MDENNKAQNDDLYNRAMVFAKNKSINNNSGISNIYVIQKTDLDGNVIDEYYGMNLMTDYGMTQFFVNGNAFPTNIYIGNGTGSFNHTTNALISPITTNTTTLVDNTISYAYPLYYDNISGLITCVCKYMTAYFDYNISGISDTITVTEYGIGSAYNALWTHSWVYDIMGSQTSINKAVNERLTITVYMCYSYYESLITDGWLSNRFTVITSMRRFFDYKMYESACYTYKRYDNEYSRTITHTSSGFMNNEITRYTNLSSFVLSAGNDNATGYIDGFEQYSSGFLTLEPQLLSTPESFTVTQVPMTLGEDCIAYAVGEKTSNMPFTQMDVSSVSLFNHKTNLWDNQESFSNDPNHYYSETSLGITMAVSIYYTNNSTNVLMYVYQNLKTNDPIIKINNNGISTVYVTDKYWDTSTWVLITDFNNIPVAQQTKRYWITTSNNISLSIKRQSVEFGIVPTNGTVLKYSFDTTTNPPNSSQSICDNYEYKWFMISNTVYAVSTGIKFNVGVSNIDLMVMTYGKWLVEFNNANTYLLVDMSVLTTAPTPVVKTPLFTNATNAFTNCYRTETGTGIICLQSLSYQQSNIIDLRNNGFNQILMNTTKASCIWGTNRIAYIPSTDTTKIRVYDFDTNTDVKEFTIPTGIASVQVMFGHKSHIWITDGTTYTYVLNINDDTITICEKIITVYTEFRYIEFTAVDDAIIIYKYGISGSSAFNEVYCIKDSEPTKPFSLIDIQTKINFNIYPRLNLRLRYIHGNTLALLMSTGTDTHYSTIMVVDFGRYLYNKDIQFRKNADYQSLGYGLYGEFIIYKINTRIPIEYFLPHRIIGTTKTISAGSIMKSISGKQWSLTMTNIPEFTGLPPGKSQ